MNWWSQGEPTALSSRSLAGLAAARYAGMTAEERGTVLRLRSLVKGRVSQLCGDMRAPGAWRQYGAFNPVTEQLDFQPHW